ncbi:MAG TPA: DNA polymerase III subunit gamma/tau [Gemmatimonadales bacterium]|nr:DNA polymerase III subunit gamma/tau [Gemmatimonadales bacterium]
MIALARKYRPKSFSDLLVQDHVAAALRGAVAQGRVAHGYLFAGPRGVGKTSAARILAMALNCENRSPEGEPCGVCDSCTRIWNGSASLDVVELDAASNRGVDDARDLRERAMYAASTESRSKVYIVDEAHMLTREAWNALLKILEEPPPRVVFVFATTEPQKIAQTAAPILSRLQRFDFRRIGPQPIFERLEQVVAREKISAEPDALRLIAKRADGGMRDALSMLDQVRSFGEGPITAALVREVLGLIPDDIYGEMLRVIAERDMPAVFPLIERLVDAGADLQEFVNGAGEVLRAVLLVGMGGQAQGFTEALDTVVRRYAPALPTADLVRLLTTLSEMEGQIRGSGHTQLAVELLLLRWALMSRTVELEQVIRSLGPAGRPDGRTGGQNEPPSPSARPPVRPSAEPPGRQSAVAPEAGLATVDRLRSLWSQIVTDARAKSQILGTLASDTEVAAVEGSVITLRLKDQNPVHVEGLERQRDTLRQIIARYVDAPVSITLQTSPAPVPAMGATPAPPPSTRPQRLTEESARAERLSRLRERDPRLNAAADAFDLELLE